MYGEAQHWVQGERLTRGATIGDKTSWDMGWGWGGHSIFNVALVFDKCLEATSPIVSYYYYYYYYYYCILFLHLCKFSLYMNPTPSFSLLRENGFKSDICCEPTLLSLLLLLLLLLFCWLVLVCFNVSVVWRTESRKVWSETRFQVNRLKPLIANVIMVLSVIFTESLGVGVGFDGCTWGVNTLRRTCVW